jgi:hypothetical protein
MEEQIWKKETVLSYREGIARERKNAEQMVVQTEGRRMMPSIWETNSREKGRCLTTGGSSLWKRGDAMQMGYKLREIGGCLPHERTILVKRR